jgi:hypothetical protein
MRFVVLFPCKLLFHSLLVSASRCVAAGAGAERQERQERQEQAPQRRWLVRVFVRLRRHLVVSRSRLGLVFGVVDRFVFLGVVASCRGSLCLPCVLVR